MTGRSSGRRGVYEQVTRGGAVVVRASLDDVAGRPLPAVAALALEFDAELDWLDPVLASEAPLHRPAGIVAGGAVVAAIIVSA